MGNLTLNAKEVYKSGMFSDLTISCNGKEFKVHKVILALQSKYFETLLGGKFKEASENRIKLDEDEADVLSCLLFFLYNFVYDDTIYTGEHRMTFIVKVYAIADKYAVPELQKLAAAKFSKHCTPLKNVDDFVDMIKTVEDCTADRALWNIILPKIKTNITGLLAADKFRDLIEELPKLNLDLLAMLDDKAVEPESYHSGSGRRLGGD